MSTIKLESSQKPTSDLPGGVSIKRKSSSFQQTSFTNCLIIAGKQK